MSQARRFLIATGRGLAAVSAAVVLLSLFAPAPALAQSESMSFFITSVGPGDGANLGGLEGADAHCQFLAEAAGAGELTWHAYLSATASGDQPVIHARDRIGEGPWHNYAGTLIAVDVEELHTDDANLTKETILTEKGDAVNGRGDSPNMHDILTGSQLDGTAISGDEDSTCQNWTSSDEGSARVGHHDRIGGGEHPTSWNSAHGSRGCGQDDLRGTGGNGFFYCFAVGAAGGSSGTDSSGASEPSRP
jgi:hypothetical protein